MSTTADFYTMGSPPIVMSGLSESALFDPRSAMVTLHILPNTQFVQGGEDNGIYFVLNILERHGKTGLGQ